MGTLKKHDVSSLQDNYNLINYVETGTGEGECLEHAIIHSFTNFHSIEIYDQVYLKAKEKFDILSSLCRKECKLYHGSSVDKLPEVLSLIEGPTLFFLDAHFPGADFRHERYDAIKEDEIRIPLKVELETIIRMKDISKDVFIIDDLWLYEDANYQTGTLNDHLDKHFPGLGYTREELSGGQNSDFIYELFAQTDTHDIKKDYRDQGYLVLTPKSQKEIL